jgi:hypothetical protein
MASALGAPQPLSALGTIHRGGDARDYVFINLFLLDFSLVKIRAIRGSKQLIPNFFSKYYTRKNNPACYGKTLAQQLPRRRSRQY